MSAHDAAALLGGLTPRRFLAQHWQKKPLLIRAALPGFGGVLTPAQLLRLACRDDAQSRLVMRTRAPLGVAARARSSAAFFRRLPARGWSVLVHEVDRFLPAGSRAARSLQLHPLRAAGRSDGQLRTARRRGRSALRLL